MVVAHVVLFKFRADVSEAHKSHFVSSLRELKSLPCVLDSQLVVGGPSITTPIERSKGFHFSLLSFHKSPEALAEYQASREHQEVTSNLLWPYMEDLIRFDFEVPAQIGATPSLQSTL